MRAQLDGPAPAIAGDGLQGSASILTQVYDLRRAIRAAATSAPASGAFKKLGQLVRPIYVAEASARFRESVSTARSSSA
ncbi:MAG: hypothetical protein ACREVO_06240 [Steroidobacteraceae bacterium]